MKMESLIVCVMVCGALPHADGHDGVHEHFPESERARLMEKYATGGGGLLAQNTPRVMPVERGAAGAGTPKPVQIESFARFAPAVKVRWDERFLFVEGNGIPAHNMMVGITAWQQQVPLPQSYTGANAWRVPLFPVPARQPVSIRDRFLRGAIAIAANGIPIFNPQNNRGEISAEIGELDEWGGHCGRADDYHYHAAPLHLQAVLGPRLPIAYALDGYPIHGLTEPDGSDPKGLDAFNGHETPGLGYHYHASKKYPYVNGGFHGEVVEAGGQVDPQPRATPIRPALQALRGARIKSFSASPDGRVRKLGYEVEGKAASVSYREERAGEWRFEFTGTDGRATTETYRAGERRGEGRGPAPAEREPGPRNGGGERSPRPREEERRQGTGVRPEPASNPEMDKLKKPLAGFLLSSPEIADPMRLPVEFTGDGAGVSPPLSWRGAPAETKSFALVMDHLAPGNEIKSYWLLWDIPGTATGLPKASKDVGKTGAGFRGGAGYEPPHSKGPGAKVYQITLYALSAPVEVAREPREVNREVLLAAMEGKVLGSATLPVAYTRPEVPGEQPLGRAEPRRPREGGAGPVGATPRARPTEENERRGGGANGGLIKPSISDTMKLNVYADNWFALYVNGRLVAVDPIPFTPHNVVSVDFLPEYPMTIAVLAKDNADPKTGMEYGTSIGDGGLILKFGDGTVTNATWKARSFFKGPLNRDTANPRVEQAEIPERWWAVDFDDSKWEQAREFSEAQIKPKQPFYDADFAGARFIWSADLELDNTVIFRTRIEKPGWRPRWNTKPDLDTTGAPLR